MVDHRDDVRPPLLSFHQLLLMVLVAIVAYGEWFRRTLVDENQNLREQLNTLTITQSADPSDGGVPPDHMDSNVGTTNSMAKLPSISDVMDLLPSDSFVSLHLSLFLLVSSFLLYSAMSDYSVARRSWEIACAQAGVKPFAANSTYGSNPMTKIKSNRSRSRSENTQPQQALRFSFSDFILYRMDFCLSSFSSAKPMALLFATYVLIVFGAAMYCLVTEASLNEAMWLCFTFVADAGEMADEREAMPRLVAVVVTLGGMMIFAVMIGVVADGVSDLLDDLKKGKSRVVESGHTLILGWSDKVLPTILELATANDSEGGGVVVVMSERDKQAMEAEVSQAFSREQLAGTIVICRSGSPIVAADLLKVSAPTAKSIIVVAHKSSSSADASDARAVRAVMSLLALQITCKVVVEMCDVDNRELVQLVGKDRVEIVVAHDIIGRLMIQSARQPGLAHILECLLGFEGDEFYVDEHPEFFPFMSEDGSQGCSCEKDVHQHVRANGSPRHSKDCKAVVTFNEVCFRFADAVPIGVVPADPVAAAAQLEDLWPSHDAIGGAPSCVNDGTGGAVVQDNVSNETKPEDSDEPSSVSDSHTHNHPPIPEYHSCASLRIDSSSSDDTTASDESATSPNRIDINESASSYTVSSNNESKIRKATTPVELDVVAMMQHQQVQQTFGLRSEDVGEPKRILLNPPGGYVMQKGDKVLVIAEDDDSYEVCKNEFPSVNAHVAFNKIRKESKRTSVHTIERLLFCGWRRDMDDMISELDKLVSPGSELVLLCTVPVEEREIRFSEGGLDVHSLCNLKLTHRVGNPVLRKHLEQIDLHNFGSILILADEAVEYNMQTADSRSLASLLLIRDIVDRMAAVASTSALAHAAAAAANSKSSSKSPSALDVCLDQYGERVHLNAPPQQHQQQQQQQVGGDDDESVFSSHSPIAMLEKLKSVAGGDEGMRGVEGGTVVISEILDSRTKSLISGANAGDYVMSNEIVACAMAMVSEDPINNLILGELLSAVGNELHVRSCLEYCVSGEELCFWDLLARSRERREIAIGYKLRQSSVAVINPRDKNHMLKWKRGDLLVVIALM